MIQQQVPDAITQMLEYWPVFTGVIGWLVAHAVHNAVVAVQIRGINARLARHDKYIDKLRDKE